MRAVAAMRGARPKDPRPAGRGEAHQTRIADLVDPTRPDLLELVGVGPIIAATALVVVVAPGTHTQRQSIRNDGQCRSPARRFLTTRHRLNRCGDRLSRVKDLAQFQVISV